MGFDWKGWRDHGERSEFLSKGFGRGGIAVCCRYRAALACRLRD